MARRLIAVASAFVIVLSAVVLSPGPALAASTGPFYVSPAGSDSNDCLSAATACLTLYHVTNDLASAAGCATR